MQLRTLGRLKLEGTDFGRPKPLLLLMYLALEGAKDRRHLAELFWRESTDPLNSLSAALKQLREVSPSLVGADAKQVWTTIRCDAKDFLSAVEAGQYEKALSLYENAFLNGVHLPNWSAELEEWVYGTRELLADRARASLLHLAETQAAQEQLRAAQKTAERAVEIAPLSEMSPEALVRLHLLLLATQSPKVREVAREAGDLGLTLSSSVEEARASLKIAFSTTRQVNNNLPYLSTFFVGREAEMEEIAGVLGGAERRLVTLLGSAGVGKSRLSVHAAHALVSANRFPDGVFFVDLTDLTEAEAIGSRLANILNVAQQGVEPVLEQVKRAIRDNHMLLVLDNYEHVIEGASITSDLLRACPKLRLMVTSRERLNVAEESVVQIEGLAYPSGPVSLDAAGEYDAVKLFTLAAQRASSRFNITAENLPAILRVCQLLDGTPLGLELAATWTRFMSVDELATEISNNLDVLETSARDLPLRHQSLKAAFEHSWRLLTPVEQAVLRRCSVFRGGFRRDAAAEVAGATLPLLASLVNKSLLRVDANWRYDRHPLLYQFTEEKLAENREELRIYQERHALYFTRQMELWHRTDFLTNPAGWFSRCEVDRANLDSAWLWCLDFGRTEEVYRVTIAWATYFEGRARLGEGAKHLERALAKLGISDQHSRLARGAVLATLGVLFWRVGRLREGAQAGEEAVRLLGPLEATYVKGWHMRWGEWWALQAQGLNFYQLGQLSLCLERFRAALALAREDVEAADDFVRRLADGYGALSLNMVAMSMIASGELTAGKRAALEALEGFSRSLPAIASYAYEVLEYACLALGEFEEAVHWAEVGLANVGKTGYETQMLPLTLGLARAQFYLGRIDQAEAPAQEALRLGALSGDRSYEIQAAALLGRIIVARGDSSTALKYLLPCLKSAHELQIVRDGLEEALLGVAEVAVLQGNSPQAARLFELLSRHPEVAQHVRDQAIGRRASLEGRVEAEDVDAAGNSPSLTLDTLVADTLNHYA